MTRNSQATKEVLVWVEAFRRQFAKTQEIVTDLKVAEAVPLRELAASVVAAQRIAAAAKLFENAGEISGAAVYRYYLHPYVREIAGSFRINAVGHDESRDLFRRGRDLSFGRESEAVIKDNPDKRAGTPRPASVCQGRIVDDSGRGADHNGVVLVPKLMDTAKRLGPGNGG